MESGTSKTDRPKRRALPRWIDRALFVVGLTLLAWVLSRYPIGDLGRACVKLGPWVCVTPLFALGWISCNTSALWLLLGRRVPWLRMLQIRLVGDGYNALLPLAGLGGEPFKVKHLSATVAVDEVLTALIRDRMIENAVGLLFTSTWLAVGLGRFRFSTPLRVAILAYVAVGVGVGVASIVLMVTSLPGRLSGVVGRWLGVPCQGAVRLPLVELVRVLVWYVLARFIGTLETATLLWLLGLGFDPITILFAYSLLNASGYIGFAIPAGLGVFEGATVYLFDVLGFAGPLGVAFALARRARMLIVGLVGVLLHVVINLRGATPLPPRALPLDGAPTAPVPE